MQTLKKFYFGRQKLKPNTFIGGIGGTINTPALLAAKLGIAVNRIKLFKVTGADVECAVVGGSYTMPMDAWSGNTTGIAYFDDIEGKCTSFQPHPFRSNNNTILRAFFPKCAQVLRQTFQGAGVIKVIYMPLLTTIPEQNNIFATGSRPTIYLNPFLATSNTGSEDAQVAYARSVGSIIRYVTNFTPPNNISNLSLGVIYNTAVQLNFTPPSSVNGIDFYEVYVDGKYNNDTRDFLATGLLPSTSYRIKIRAVDMFYNKGDFSNEITVTTLTSNDFISTWKTDNISTGSSSTTQIKLPLVSSGSYNFTVDWGDGTQNIITAWNQVDTVHTYSAIGAYTVRINGVCNGWYFGNSGDRLKLLSIVDWGRLQLSNGNVFHGCSNLSLQNVQGFLDLHYVTSMSSFFDGCSSITTINNVNSWPVGNVQGMNNMFSGATSFNQNIGGWNTSIVTNMSSMFSSAWNFNNGGSPSIGNWNTSNVITMANMFQNCTFNQNISNWNTSKVTSMAGMFYKSSTAGGFNNGLASGVAGDMFWDMSKVTNVSQMFQNASDFNQNLGVLNLSLCTNFTSMFNGATKFNNGGSIDINNWTLNTTNPVTMNSMFLNATVFNQPIGNWNIINVTSTASMFQGATNFNNGLASGVAGNMFWNFRNVTSTSAMFFNSTSFEQNLGAVNMSKNTVLTDMFNGATKFNNGGSIDINNWTLNTTSPVTMNSMFLNATVFNQSIGNWNTIKATTTASMFSGASAFNNGLTSGVAGNMLWNLQEATTVNNMFLNATSFNQNLGALNLPLCTNFTSMFQNASKFNNGGSTDINNWTLNTTGSILMNNMFSGASIFNQNIGSWNTSKVTSMTAMFASALAFDNGGSDSINNWNTANVTSMTSMFSNCAFNQPVGNWNVSKVTTTQDMFRRTLTVGSFNQNISSWNMSAVTNSSGMFANLLVFNNGLASGVAGDMLWNLSNVTNCNTMFFNATSFNQNLGILNMSKNVSFSDMFNGANKFNNGGSADINNWVLNTTGTLSLAGAFKNCTLFNQPLNNWNVSKVTSMNQTFNGAAAFDQNIGSWNVSSVTDFTNFMLSKTPATFSAANLNVIYNGWSSRPVKTPITISFGTAKHSTASSAGKDILIMTPNNWTIGDGGSTDGIANTYIGGIGSTINTPALLATKLGISINRIENFSVTGSDVECIVIGGSYRLPSSCWSSNLQITYYTDSDGLVSVVGQQAFGNIGTQFKSFYFPKATKIEQTIGNWSFQSTGNLIKNTWKLMYVPLVTQWGNTQQADINGQTQGTQVFRSNFDFNGVIYAHPSLQTSNAGGLEGDLAYLLSLNTGATIRYVTNFTPPETITNLSAGLIYNTTIQLNFTTPTAVNGIDFYEVYVNGKLNKEIKNSGEFITGLTPATNYNITVVAVDVFYNKSAFSNAVNFTTTNKTPTDTDAIAYINASSNSFYQDIIDDMFIGLKNQNLYTKIQAFYPFLGTTQAQHKWNAKNPLDTNAAFRLQFFGGGTHSNLGYQCNGTNAYGNTNFIPRTNLSPTNCGTTIVSGTNNNTNSTDIQEIGCQSNATDIIRQSVKSDNTNFTRQAYISNHNIYTTGVNDARGVFTQSKTSSSLLKSYRNGVLLGQVTTTVSGTVPNIPIWIGVCNGNGRYSNQRIQFTAIHEGLTDAEVVALHTIIDNFEAAIGRKTW